MTEIKRFGIISVAKISGVIYCVIGLIFGLLFALISILNMAAPSDGGMVTAGLGSVALLILAFAIAVLYGILGFIFGGLIAWVYNVAAGWIGGIEMEIGE
ncbi:hypothetical protein [Methanofollis sp. UBA420]|jgi:hypothetical protein|uniref:hypothetical protein n=1 Tax=Methanofollis sp. UBA420 TaxID=1915514 RepID=UPI00316ABEEB